MLRALKPASAGLLLVALTAALAAPARATVRPPVEVFLRGNPGPAVAGQAYTATLEITGLRDVELSDFRVEGEGWSGLALDAPAVPGFSKAAPLRLVRSQPLTIVVQGLPTNPAAPLVVSFEVNGRPYQKSFDLSPQAMKLGERGSAVHRAVPGGEQPAPRGGVKLIRPAPLREAPDPNTEQNRARQRGAGPTNPQQVTARSIRVHGRFAYQRQDGTVIGADAVRVRVYDEDTGPDELLVDNVTDPFGYFDYTFYWDPCLFCDSQPDLYIVFSTENSKVVVKTASAGSVYAWGTGTTNDYTGIDLDYGTLYPGSESQDPAVHVLTDLVRTWRWILNNPGYDLPGLEAYWPEGTDGAYYNGNIHVSTGEQWSEGTHSHEYGHHWMANYGTEGTDDDYCNGICDTPPPCGHCIWCQETADLAWIEGWPDWESEVVTRSYAGDYGLAAQFQYDFEPLGDCGANDDPTRTEGFLTALLWDIDDSAQDDHNAGDPWTDRLAMGWDEVFTVADLDGVTTPLGFIGAFKTRYPSTKENLWETAKNVTYEVDAANPSSVTGLVSTSHSTSGSSPDPTIDFAWTRANDDWSGPSGYSVLVSGAPSLPDQIQDIGDVTSYTTSTLAPGTYYFNIRTKDRSGKWASGYASAGPYTIRAAEPANLTFNLFAGWSRVTVPRGAADASFSSVPNPTTLPSNTSSTYWNVGGINNGESATSTGFSGRCYLDGSWNGWSFSWGSILAGQGFYGVNAGPFTVRGGRHHFESRLDAVDAISETSEGDNVFAHPWIWTPLSLAVGNVVTRSAPPTRDGGWSSVTDGSPLWFNCDGLRFSSGAIGGEYWYAVWLKANNNADDYDCRMHFGTGNADTGFAANRGYSTRAAGCLDAVLANRNKVGIANWDVGVLQSAVPGASTYTAKFVNSTQLAFGDSVTVTMPANEYLLLREFYVAPGNVGPVSLVIDHDPALGPLAIEWLNQDFQTGDLLDYSAIASSDGAGRARLDVTMPTSGFQCLVIYRDPRDGGTGAVPMTVEIEKTPPDPMVYSAAGWYAAFVPRKANDGTPLSVPMPDSLYGEIASTYFNFAARNNSPSTLPGVHTEVDLDGAYNWFLDYGAWGANTNSLFNWGTAWTVRGGRHTLGWKIDPGGIVEEIFETNNRYGEQWNWSPLALTLGSAVTRAAPPDQVGGWADITNYSGGVWYNCDGVRAIFAPSGSNGYWGAFAAMPGSASNVDLRLHERLTGAKNGFGANLAYSGWGAGLSDYLLVDFNQTSFRGFDAGVLRIGSGTQTYTIEAVNSIYRGFLPNGQYGPFTLGPNHILHLHEFFLDAGTYEIDLDNYAGTVNWGLSLHPRDVAYQTKSTVVPGGSSWSAGPGGDEVLAVTITYPGFYCVAVWKNGQSDLALSGQYLLRVLPTSPTDVPGELALATSLSALAPNPARLGAGVWFSLAQDQDIALEVFDVRGGLVQTLARGRWPAGRHQVAWDGRDAAGRRVPGGVYLVRLTAGRYAAMRKLAMLR